ncbi:hypothetical protein ACRCRN_32255 [Pseudomonas aeruginosa]|jgi:hypothetical protein
MSPLHFSLIFSGTVSPDGGDAEAENIALTPVELLANLEQAVNTITGNGLVTGDSPATLDEHSHCVRVTSGKLDMMAMPVISTAHLDEGTAQLLFDRGDLCNWATVAPYQEGFFVRFIDECHDQMPQCAKDVHLWLKREQLNGWVRFDRDWPTVEGLPAYEW